MDLELWIQMIIEALKNGDSHVRFIFIPRSCFDYDECVVDDETGDVVAVKLIKSSKAWNEHEAVAASLKSLAKATSISSKDPPKEMYC